MSARCLLLCLLSLLWLVPSAQAGRTVKAIGQARIQTDKAEAKARALNQALNLALAHAVVNHLPDTPVKDHFQRISPKFENGEKYIQRYQVLAESQVGRAIVLLVEAEVSLKAFEKELAIFQPPEAKKPKTLPSVLFAVAEQKIGDLSPRYWWSGDPAPIRNHSEKALAEVFAEKGFSVVAHGFQPPEMALEAAVIYQPELENQEALAMAGAMEAEVVVAGKSMVYQVPNTLAGEKRSFSGTVNLRALDRSTGKELASVLKSHVSVSTDPEEGCARALQEAGRLAGEALAEKLLSRQKPSPETDKPAEAAETENGSVRILLSGTRHLGSFIHFRRVLNALEGVAGFHIEEMGADTARLEVKYPDTAEALAEALIAREYESFGLDITEVTQTSMKASLIPK